MATRSIGVQTNPKNIAEDIKKTILEFIKDLKDNVFVHADERGDLALVEFLFKKMIAINVADHMVAHVLLHETAIKKRDVNFFVKEKDSIFVNLPKDRVDHFANLVLLDEDQGGFSQDDRDNAWSYFDTLMELTKQYRKVK